MYSEDFTRFKESFFPTTWEASKEGPIVESLLALQGEEGELAERMLLEKLSSNTISAALGLGELHSQKASKPLKALLSHSTGEELVEVAMALWKIEQYPHSRDLIISVLRGDDRKNRRLSVKIWIRIFGENGYDRIAAANALKHFHCKESIKALVAALRDGDEGLRDRAARSLFDHLFLLDSSFPGDYELLHALASPDVNKYYRARKVVEEWIKDKGYL